MFLHLQTNPNTPTFLLQCMHLLTSFQSYLLSLSKCKYFLFCDFLNIDFRHFWGRENLSFCFFVNYQGLGYLRSLFFWKYNWFLFVPKIKNMIIKINIKKIFLFFALTNLKHLEHRLSLIGSPKNSKHLRQREGCFDLLSSFSSFESEMLFINIFYFIMIFYFILHIIFNFIFLVVK